MKYSSFNFYSILLSQLQALIKFIYPPLCLICDARVEDYQQICDDCLLQTDFTNTQVCSNCGDVLDDNELCSNDVTKCNACLETPPYFCKFISPLYYNGTVSKIISKFKYQDHPELAKELAKLLSITLAATEWNDIDFIIPMPISYRRLLIRKYNQVLLLAKYLSYFTDIPMKSNLLVKTKHTKQQASLKLAQRAYNIKSSFAIKTNQVNSLNNKVVLLIDDIVTTGYTINEVSKVLSLAGTKRVYILSLARVKGDFKIFSNIV